MKSIILLATLCCLSPGLIAAADFFSINSGDCDVRVIDQQGTTKAIRFIQSHGINFQCFGFGMGLVRHPVQNDLYANVRFANTNSTRLLKITSTGELSVIGNTGDHFESLAINADGSVLYGVTMDSGSIVPETLFTIDKSNASTKPLCSLQHGHTTKAIAFNTADGMIYHGSGIDLQLFEKLNLQTCQTTPIGFQTDQLIGPMALVYVGSNNFLLADGRLYDVTSDGVVTNSRSMDHASKGLAVVQGPLKLSNLSITGNCRRTKKTVLLENVTVRNNAGTTAIKALLGTRIPTGLQFVSDSSGRCSVTQDLLTCPLNDLAPMASVTLQIRYSVSLPQNSIIRHDLRVSSNEFELIQNAGNNTLAINSSCK